MIQESKIQESNHTGKYNTTKIVFRHAQIVKISMIGIQMAITT